MKGCALPGAGTMAPPQATVAPSRAQLTDQHYTCHADQLPASYQLESDNNNNNNNISINNNSNNHENCQSNDHGNPNNGLQGRLTHANEDKEEEDEEEDDGDDDDDDDDDEDAADLERYKLIDKIRFKLFMSELLGAFVFVYLAQAALASFELTGTQGDLLTRQLATVLAQGLAYLFASLLAQGLSGAHLSPAYTFASAAFGRLQWARVPIYLLAQYSGSFLAAIFLHATYSDKLAQRHLEGLLGGPNSSLRAHGSILSTGKLFSSYPPTEVSLAQLAVSYTLATAHLSLLVLAVQEARLVRVARSLRPLYLGGALSLVLAAFSANGGPVWNPAQDLAPRLYIGLFGWGGGAAFNPYNFKYWWLCGLAAPHAGALIGFAVYRLLEHLRAIPSERPARVARSACTAAALSRTERARALPAHCYRRQGNCHQPVQHNYDLRFQVA